MAVWGGREFASTTTNLISGWAVAVLGGIALDLRDAKLGSEGASLALRATVGGIAVTVPDDWRVVVESNVKAGGVVCAAHARATFAEPAAFTSRN